MYRRSLVLRRFGAMDFGLGYFEGGRWVDHTTLPDGGASLGIGDGAFGAIHDLLECCRSRTAPGRTFDAIRSRPIPVGAGPLPVTLVDRREHVQPVSRRSSAG